MGQTRFGWFFSLLVAFVLLVPGLWLAWYMDGIQPPATTDQRLNRENANLTAQEFLLLDGIDLNTAGPEELELLPGVGKVLARRILDYRTQQGGFTQMEQLLEVKGIGPKTLERIARRGYIVEPKAHE